MYDILQLPKWSLQIKVDLQFLRKTVYFYYNFIAMCDRLVGMKIVMMYEVMRSGKQQQKAVPMALRLTDSDDRPSQVTEAPYLLTKC